ncbi:MAG: tripartite tricarboxylate transporter TctB family protein, partial [Deltaproteobacteria bacterium]|nr:tripartite tricarboxylate transporter TctB family protein [Deltaproteobacteria bacterium]
LDEGEAEATEADKPEHKSATWRFYITISAGFFMFAGIYLVGFYLGSGLMMLVWFAVFRRLNAGTITLSIATPLLLFLTFEKLLDMGLPSGELLSWLGL